MTAGAADPRLRVAIVGCGGIARAHALAYRSNPRAELVGVYDIDRTIRIKRANTIVTKDEIHREVFGYGFDPGTNTIDVHLLALRRKLDKFPITLETIRGEGIRCVVTRPTH